MCYSYNLKGKQRKITFVMTYCVIQASPKVEGDQSTTERISYIAIAIAIARDPWWGGKHCLKM